LIDEVIADFETQAGEIILVLHWAGGVHMHRGRDVDLKRA
jgi:hypothetical protein